MQHVMMFLIICEISRKRYVELNSLISQICDDRFLFLAERRGSFAFMSLAKWNCRWVVQSDETGRKAYISST